MPVKAFDFSGLIAKNVPAAPAARPASGRLKYDFTTAFPDPGSFPSKGLLEALTKALEKEGSDLVYYPHPQGHPEIRQFIANKLARERGMKVKADQVVLTSGSGQAIARYVELFTDPGDTLLTEEFTYSGTLAQMRRHSADIHGVTMDGEGMRPDALDKTIRDLRAKGKKIKFIYTIPTFQNPVGTDMGLQRRKDILAVAQKHSVPIFEDDCYVDLRFEGEDSPAIHSLDNSGLVFYSGSASKIVGPGMRLGWMVAPDEVIQRVGAIHLGATPSQFSALATWYYLLDHLEDHVAELRSIFKAKKDTAYAAVGEYMGPRVVSSNPKGALYLWLRLPEGADTAAALPKARSRNVGYGPGVNFSPQPGPRNYLRVCYGHLAQQEIEEGVAELARVFQEEGMLS